MNGLDLESFLLLLRADLSVWLVLGFASLGLAFLVWSSWSSRRALRNCLVLSLAAHLALVLYGSAFPGILWSLTSDRRHLNKQSHIREIRVSALVEPVNRRVPEAIALTSSTKVKNDEQPQARGPRWDVVDTPLALEDKHLQVSRPTAVDEVTTLLQPRREEAAPAALATATPKGTRLASEPRPPEPRALADTKTSVNAPAAGEPLPANVAEIEGGVADRSKAVGATEGRPDGPEQVEPSPRGAVVALRSDRRLRPERSELASADGSGGIRLSSPDRVGGAGAPGTNRNGQPAVAGAADKAITATSVSPLSLPGTVGLAGKIPSVRATPKARAASDGGQGLASLVDRTAGPTLAEIPKIYQPRLDPHRSTQAQRIGASAASELAVERAIDWLNRHQDADGRWDAGIARYAGGEPVKGDDDFTAHCPAGETCFGECAYWEADTALTGLALLTYLGAGYTHTDGRYAESVGKGLDFLLSQQKRDGDLRGRSKVVGMYCHAMATLALCEAYALTGDARLRDPVERAVAFMVSARAADGMAWRYAPGAPAGDTSILGWVVMGLKSAKEVGIAIPDEPSVRRGTLLWLDKVASGDAKGLARYQPSEQVTPTMTAEAWVCRQFLGVGGPGPASSEAAEFLLKKENESDRGPSNVYYWYYATLALYQHGGEAWSTWNSRLRDRLVGLQRNTGHQMGSWEPDQSLYGSKGGRVYCTALAALTLEVYYRYLRLYDEPKIPLEAGVTPALR